MVDVLYYTADNTVMTDMARLQRHPPVGELGEVDDKYVIGTAEILLLPCKGMMYNQGNKRESQMGNRKSECSQYRRNC